jgi:hypothetical protein
VDLSDLAYFRKVIDRQPPVGKKLYYFLATGNLVSSTGLDLMQASGYTVVADKINFMRFTTHFRSVHRGQFFAEMKTTTVRKLLPENWGFLCPIHTPDGGPCGLLNHLAAPCNVVAFPVSHSAYSQAASAVLDTAPAAIPPFETALYDFLVSLGLTPAGATATVSPASHLPVMLDGRLLGTAHPHLAFRISRAIRRAKALSSGVRAGIDRMGLGKLEGQDEEALNLLRASVLGLTDHRTPAERGFKPAAYRADPTSSAAPREEERKAAEKPRKKRAGTKDADADMELADADSSVARGGRTLGLGTRAGLPAPPIVVPPSLEVAFLPPPWWDAEVDPLLADDLDSQRGYRAAERRVARYLAHRGADSDSEEEDGAAAKDGSSRQQRKDRAREAKRAEEEAVPGTKLVGLFPGLFLQSAPARLIRPVLQLDTGLVELVSPLEQPYLDIACTPEDITDILHVDPAKGAETPMIYTHSELSAMAMLSEVASLTPFSDLNQSPRNMYQVRTRFPFCVFFVC